MTTIQVRQIAFTALQVPTTQNMTSYVSDGEKLLLHGILKINVIEAENLPDMDRCCFNIHKKDTSDPYVNIYLGHSRMATTKHLDNDVNPKWNQKITFDVCV